MKEVEVSAPGKLMLFGEHAVVYNRPCLVTAVDQRMMVAMEISARQVIEIEAPGVGIRNYRRKVKDLGKGTNIPKGVRFLERAIKNFFDQYQVESGLKIKTKSEFSSQFGFGSSSAVTAATLEGLSILLGINLSKKELFNLAYKTVLDLQGVGSGFDLAAAIWGGTVYFVTGGKRIIPLKKMGKLPLVIGYSGVKAETPTLVRQVESLYLRYPRLVEGIFDHISLLTREAKKALVEGNFKKGGELMNLNQGLLESLGVNTKKLAALIFAAREAGAYGAKLSGAGGGDCMIALVNKETKPAVERAIGKSKGLVIKVQTGAEGVRRE
ncbi:mevalonate kinase [Candidatus Shapirobacteria bacterium]|nr:mevalonate kinase [Candidatus Shapirobacteria bacterium]